MLLSEKLKALQPLDMADEDPCCGKDLSKALRAGTLKDKTVWIHEKCGCRWKFRQMSDGSRHWHPVVEIWIF